MSTSCIHQLVLLSSKINSNNLTKDLQLYHTHLIRIDHMTHTLIDLVDNKIHKNCRCWHCYLHKSNFLICCNSHRMYLIISNLSLCISCGSVECLHKRSLKLLHKNCKLINQHQKSKNLESSSVKLMDKISINEKMDHSMWNNMNHNPHRDC